MLLGLVVLVLVDMGPPNPDTLRASLAYKYGRQAERREGLALAANELERVVEEYPGSPIAVSHLGTPCYPGGNMLKAQYNAQREH